MSEKIFKLGGWEKNSFPVLTSKFYEGKINRCLYSAVLKYNYEKSIDKDEIIETLKLSTGDVYAVCYQLKVTEEIGSGWRIFDTIKSVPAIYFSAKTDLVMFKLTYSDIIVEVVDGDEKPGIKTINIDIDKLKKKISGKNR